MSNARILGRGVPGAPRAGARIVDEAWRDVKNDPELTPAQEVLAAGIAAVICAPAVVLELVGP